MPQSKNGLTRMGKDRWKARFRFVSPATGELIDTERTFAAKNKIEAKAERDRLFAELHNGGLQTKADRVPLREFALAWYEARRQKLRYSTQLRYVEQLNIITDGAPRRGKQAAVEGLGDIFLDAVSVRHVERFVAALAERFGGNTVANILRLLKALTKAATHKYDLPKDVAAGVENPLPRPKYDVDAEGLNSNMFTGAELAAVWNAFREHEPQWFARVAVSAMGGLRPGEVGALIWGDLDLVTGLLRITRKVYRGRIEEQAKTSAGRRSIVLPEPALEILRPLAKGHKPTDFLFPSTVGKPAPDGALLKPLRRVVARLGFKKHLTPYAFRRSFNSLGVGTVPSEVLRKTVGHVSQEMTEHYLAVDLAGKRQLADGVAAKIFPAGAGDKPESPILPVPANEAGPTPSSPASPPN